MEPNYTLYQSKDAYGIFNDQGSCISIIDRDSLKPLPSLPYGYYWKIPFYSILGIFTCTKKEKKEKKETQYRYLGIITKIAEVNRIGKHMIYAVDSFQVLPLQKEENSDSDTFKKLVIKGLSRCTMYFSQTYDLTQTYPQHLRGQNSRDIFIWNLKALQNMKTIWPSADICQKVIAGDITRDNPDKKSKDIMIISRRSNRNGGCHNWTRGCDYDGYAANFIETEELYFKDDHNLISHVEISGSAPLFWSQYPSTNPKRPFHYGSENECHHRFVSHFNNLHSLYNTFNGNTNEPVNIIIVSLLASRGKEKIMNEKLEKEANKSKIDFKHLDINELMKKNNQIRCEINNMFLNEENPLADATVVKDGNFISYQHNLLRVNCASSLDRTSVFMSILTEFVMKKYIQELSINPNFFDTSIHNNVWENRANNIAWQYAATPGMKLDMIGTGNRSSDGYFRDSCIQLYRYFNAIFFEGTYTDSFNAILQERKFCDFEHQSLWMTILYYFFFLLLFAINCIYYCYVYFTQGRKHASHVWCDSFKKLINHPHFDDLRDADEFQDSDFPNENPSNYSSS